MSYSDIVDEIATGFEHVHIEDTNNIDHYNHDLISYIESQKIDIEIKQLVINLIANDNYNDYISVYNICVENNIELPPI